MEHAPYDIKGLAEYMRGLAAGRPAKSRHRTPPVILNVPSTVRMRRLYANHRDPPSTRRERQSYPTTSDGSRTQKRTTNGAGRALIAHGRAFNKKSLKRVREA
jgi:hypothetical protein